MSKPNLINYSEWMAELKRLQEEVPETRGLTMRELARHYGKHSAWISNHILRPMQDEGRLQTFKRKTTDLTGRTCWITEYLPKAVPRETKKTG